MEFLSTLPADYLRAIIGVLVAVLATQITFMRLPPEGARFSEAIITGVLSGVLAYCLLYVAEPLFEHYITGKPTVNLALN